MLIDVREPHEYKICSIPGAKLIPLGEFPQHVGEFDPEDDIVIHCRSGMRSAQGLRRAAPGGLPARAQRGGRHSGVER